MVAPGFAGLLGGFLDSAQRFPDHPALLVDRRELTYHALRTHAAQIAAAIHEFQPQQYPLAALLASRSLTAYAGILAILASGKGYVPLNPKFPRDRTSKMLARSGCRVLIADSVGQVHLKELLAPFAQPLTVILPDSSDITDFAAAIPRHHFISAGDLPPAASAPFRPQVDPSDTAYLLFTSGSTGEPKGVPISHSNVCAYLENTCDRYEVNHHDRVSQEFDLTFDLSVHDMFVAWERGACLCCVPENALMAPAKFIRDSKLTLWFSVPSVAGFLSKMRLLNPGSFPTLRWSLFCGEPLPASYARQWQDAAPNSIIENLYGPTETTIAITRYRWDSDVSPAECNNGIVPIGWPYPEHRTSVVDERLCPVPQGSPGELCLAGPQVSLGYLHDPKMTAQQFVLLPEEGHAVWYRTGDLVEQRPDGCLRYLGRLDHQVKIRGYRVELQEIEGLLRAACGTEQVAAVPWPVMNSNADGIVAFVAGMNNLDPDSVLERCRRGLPDYMVPRKIHRLSEMPLNANGKMDRKKLAQYLEEDKP